MAKKTKPVCSYCGSDEVKGDAYVHWSFEEQKWEVYDTFDKGSVCEACGGECSFDWVDVEVEPEPLELGKSSWCIEDIHSEAEELGYKLTDAQAEAVLREIDEQLSEAAVDAGWHVIGTKLMDRADDWEKEGEPVVVDLEKSGLKYDPACIADRE